MHITQVMDGVHLHVRACARADVPPFLPRKRLDGLRLNLVCVQRPICQAFTKFKSGAHLHVRTPFWHLGNGQMDCSEIWYVVRDPLARRFTEVSSGMHVHVCTCSPPFCISRTAGQIVLKYDAWLGYHELCVLHRMGYICTSARVIAHTFKYIYSLPLVYRQKGVLLLSRFLADLFCSDDLVSKSDSFDN